MANYSFCEGVHATGYGRWHIRKLTEKGKFLSGGIDTDSLCGHVRKGWGWDLSVEIDERRLQHCCLECARKYRDEERK